jgi:hypothetical protein
MSHTLFIKRCYNTSNRRYFKTYPENEKAYRKPNSYNIDIKQYDSKYILYVAEDSTKILDKLLFNHDNHERNYD